MAPQLSPKKTWEGAAANLLGSAIVAVALFRWLNIDAFQAVLMACLANGAGQAGDLLKSAYKRGAGVKDSGTLLPGHGGVLDRIDALILAAPVVWYYFRFVLAALAVPPFVPARSIPYYTSRDVNPSRIASFVNSAMVRTPSLSMILRNWSLTVASLR